MKKSRLGLPMVALVMGLAPTFAVAQDPVKVAPDNYKVTVNNSRVRVLDVHIKPGEKIPMHSHPGYVAVGITPCKVRFTSPDGKSAEVDLKEGETFWRDAESHAAENIGTAECHALNIEVKGASGKKAPSKKAK